MACTMAAPTSALAVEVDEAEELVDFVREMDAAARDLLQVDASLGAELEQRAGGAGDRGRPGGARAVPAGAPDPRWRGGGPSSARGGRSRRHRACTRTRVSSARSGRCWPTARGRHRVGIGVEAHARVLGDDERDDEVGIERVRGQGRAGAGARSAGVAAGARAWWRGGAGWRPRSCQRAACARRSSSEANERP